MKCTTVAAVFGILFMPAFAAPVIPPNIRDITNNATAPDHVLEAPGTTLNGTIDEFDKRWIDQSLVGDWRNPYGCNRPCFRMWPRRNKLTGEEYIWLEVAMQGLTDNYDHKFMKKFYLSLRKKCGLEDISYVVHRKEHNDLYATFSPNVNSDACVIATLNEFGSDDCWRCYSVVDGKTQDNWETVMVQH